MPAKVYVDSPPAGDFRAMPAIGGGIAVLKWVTSFPAQPGTRPAGRRRRAARLRRRDRRADGDPRLRRDHLAAHRRGGRGLRPGAGARRTRATVGVVGCGVNGAFAARCLAACGYGERAGSAPTPSRRPPRRLAAELGWSAGTRAEAAAADVVVTVTPGDEPVIEAADLRPGQHLAVLGADAHGKAEVDDRGARALRAVLRRVGAGLEGRRAVRSRRRGARDARRRDRARGGARRRSSLGAAGAEQITLFDSTGLAIQDLGIALAVLESDAAARRGSPDRALVGATTSLRASPQRRG